MQRAIIIIGIAVVALATSARADQWVSPSVQKLTSQKFEAVITPADDGKSGAKVKITDKTKNGGAPSTFTLKAEWMPVDSVLFDDGSLLTLDNWHTLGHGTVGVLYERTGVIRWSKNLVELAGQAVADSAQASVSSIWWRKTPLEQTLAKDRKSISITLFDENKLEIALADGTAKVVTVAVSDDPKRMYNRAQSLVEKDWKAAVAILEKAIAKDPDYLSAIFLYAETLHRNGEHARVLAQLEKMSKAWSAKAIQDIGYEVANIAGTWAKSAIVLGKKDIAERVLRVGVLAAPTYNNPTTALATLLADSNRQKEADMVLDQFVERLFKASYVDQYALASIAEWYKQRKLHPKALSLYLKGYKKTEVTNQFLYADLAKLYEELGNFVEAVRIQEQLLAHFTKMGSAFDMYIKETKESLVRLRAKQKK